MCPQYVPGSALAQLGRRADWVGDDDLVFVGEVGGYLDGSALRRRYKEALGRASLRPLRFHDLRHTFGTRAGDSVVSPVYTASFPILPPSATPPAEHGRSAQPPRTTQAVAGCPRSPPQVPPFRGARLKQSSGRGAMVQALDSRRRSEIRERATPRQGRPGARQAGALACRRRPVRP